MIEKPFKLSETGRAMLRLGARREDCLVPPPTLPVAAARQVMRSLLNAGMVEEVPEPADLTGYLWRAAEDGTRLVLRATVAGLDAINETASSVTADDVEMPDTNTLAICALDSSDVAPDLEIPKAASTREDIQVSPVAPAAPTSGFTLRQAAQSLLEAWDDEANDRAGVPAGMKRLRDLLTRPRNPPTSTRAPREGTKQEAVLAMLRRPEGATVAQIAEAMGWAPHTVRGFFAGLKKRQRIIVVPAERIRQVGPNTGGAKGSYTIYRIAEAG